MAKDNESASLSFPHATFATVTPKAYLQAHLKQDNVIRPNGRTQDQFRDATINSGSLAYSNGSAVVRLGDTAVVCGVRGEILQTSDIPLPPHDNIADEDMIQHLGLLVPNLELSTGCSPAHLPGNPPSALAQSLTWRLYSLLHSTTLIDIDALRITYDEAPVDDESEAKTVTKAYWVLYLDILCISLDGNCFDAAWIALLAALRNTTLPKANWNADKEIVVCSPLYTDATRLHLSSLPISSTFATISTASPLKNVSLAEQWTLADPDTFEEEACSEHVTITVNKKGIVRVEKSGGPSLGVQQMKHCLKIVFTRQKQIESLLTSS